MRLARPLPPPINYGPSSPLLDEAADSGYSLLALQALLDDCRAQPDWRTRSDRACRFYDMGKQLTPQKEAIIRREWGIEPRQTNLIHGVINSVLGQEAKSRSDVRVEADEDKDADLCDVFNVRLKQAARESNLDRAISDAYAGMVKSGIGWLEVSRASDPLDPPYRARSIHRREIWYDMTGTEPWLDDAKWLVRKRWQDLDEAVALLPEHADLLKQAVHGWSNWTFATLDDEGWESSALARGWSNERRTTIRRDEWCDTARRRVQLYEVWYRVPAEVVVMRTGPTRTVVFEPNNPLHAEAVSRGIAKLIKTTTRQVRMALFAGPHRLIDTATHYRRYPYIPFFAYRDDEDRSPYGLIESMISPQEEYNERRQLFNWMLLAKQMVVDADAAAADVNTIADWKRAVMRRDFVAVLNPNRKFQDALKIGTDVAAQAEQFKAMEDAKNLIQEVARVYGTQLGDAPAGVTSGYAINSLVDQGQIAQGEMNDNYIGSRTRGYEAMLDLVIEDHMDENLRVVIGMGKHKREIIINTWDEQTGEPVNRVKDSQMRVGLSDAPSSPAHRAQEQQQLSTIIQGLQNVPPAMAVLAPAWVEGSTLANRQALGEGLRTALGVPDPADKDGKEQAAQAAQAEQAQAAEMQAAAMQTKLEREGAAAERDMSAARLNDAKTAQLGAPQIQVPPGEEIDPEEQAIQEALAEAGLSSRPSLSGPVPGVLH